MGARGVGEEGAGKAGDHLGAEVSSLCKFSAVTGRMVGVGREMCRAWQKNSRSRSRSSRSRSRSSRCRTRSSRCRSRSSRSRSRSSRYRSRSRNSWMSPGRTPRLPPPSGGRRWRGGSGRAGLCRVGPSPARGDCEYVPRCEEYRPVGGGPR